MLVSAVGATDVRGAIVVERGDELSVHAPNSNESASARAVVAVAVPEDRVVSGGTERTRRVFRLVPVDVPVDVRKRFMALRPS